MDDALKLAMRRGFYIAVQEIEIWADTWPNDIPRKELLDYLMNLDPRLETIPLPKQSKCNITLVKDA